MNDDLIERMRRYADDATACTPEVAQVLREAALYIQKIKGKKTGICKQCGHIFEQTFLENGTYTKFKLCPDCREKQHQEMKCNPWGVKNEKDRTYALLFRAH